MKYTTFMVGLLLTIMPPGPVYADNGTGAPASWPEPMMGDKRFSSLWFDRLEYGHSDEGETQTWDVQGWYGNDKNKVWLKTEGEGPLNDSPESAEIQVLYGRMLSTFFDAQVGVRYDSSPDPDRSFAVVGLQGLAPYWFETDTAFYLSEEGDLSFRAELEYELLFTQKLILQPRLEFTLSADEVPEYGVGRGLTETEIGLRLRYEINRQFAPYIGISWSKKYGDTQDFATRADEPDSITSLVAGVRFWF